MLTDENLQNNRLALRLLRDSIASVRFRYLLFFLVILIVAVVSLAPPQIYRYFFQYIKSNNNQTIIKLLLFGTSIALCSMLATAISIYAREWLRCQIELYLRKTVLKALSGASLSKLERVHRGEWIACTSGDLIETEDFLTMSFPEQIKNFLMFIGACSLFLYHGGFFGLVPFGLALGLIGLNLGIQRRMRPALSEVRELHGEVYQQLLENFEGLRTIRSFAGENMVQNNFSNKLRVINTKSMNIMRSFAVLIGTNELFILLGISSILALILNQFMVGHISFDDALVYPFYMGIFFMSVASFYRSNYDWNLFFTKGGRLASLIYNFEDSSDKFAKHQHIYNSQVKRLDFKNIELKYPGHELLIPLFNISIKKYELLGIIGPSGCGKSTFLEFLAGLRPLSIDGKDILLPTSLTSYVEQKPYILAGSVLDNLRFGCNIDASEECIWQALKKSRLDNLFRTKNGLNFQVQERGQNLSEGEKYRLGITRAILTNKPFLLMDEPFAALDFLSIKAIVQLINSERQNRGIVIVTHYLPPKLTFDQFIDFELLAKKDAFAPQTRFNAPENKEISKVFSPFINY
jgi:ABC-type multidrug transport system fused ATPase/permease subunit